MAYFTNVGPDSGALKYYAAPGAIDVLESRDGGTRVGTALPVRNDPDGVSIWRLTVHGAELPGLFTVVDREFRPSR
jgi:hypothetical protein